MGASDVARVEWIPAEGRNASLTHAVVDGDVVTLCGQPKSFTAVSVPDLAAVIACGECVALIRELAGALEQLVEVDGV